MKNVIFNNFANCLKINYMLDWIQDQINIFFQK